MNVGQLKKALENISDDIDVTVDDSDGLVLVREARVILGTDRNMYWDMESATGKRGPTFWIGAA